MGQAKNSFIIHPELAVFCILLYDMNDGCSSFPKLCNAFWDELKGLQIRSINIDRHMMKVGPFGPPRVNGAMEC